MKGTWPISLYGMVFSLPVLFLALLAFIYVVIEFAPQSLRQHRVSFRPIQTHLADLVLIIRLVFKRR